MKSLATVFYRRRASSGLDARLGCDRFLLVAAMQVYFFLTGFDRPFPYQEVQVVSFLASIACVWGAWSEHRLAFALGLGVNLVARLLQPILGVTRLPLWSSAILTAGWAIACVQAARGRDASAGAWLLALGHVLAMLTATERLGSMMALGVGAIGLFLAAPNLPANDGPLRR